MREARLLPLSIRHALQMVCALGIVGLALPSMASPSVLAQDVQLRARLQVVCDMPVGLVGSLKASDGALGSLENLSMQSLTTGAMWLDGQRSVTLAPSGPINRLGFDIEYQGPRDAELVLELQFGPFDQLQREDNSTTGPATNSAEDGANFTGVSKLRTEIQLRRIRIPIARLIGEYRAEEIYPGLRLWVGRLENDSLRIALGARDHTVFETGEVTPWAVTASGMRSIPAGDLQLLVRLNSDLGGEPLWQQTYPVSAEAARSLREGGTARIAQGQLKIPDSESSYQLDAKLMRKETNRILSQLPATPFDRSPTTVARGKLQLVAIAPLPPQIDQQSFEVIREWTPTNANFLSMTSARILGNTVPYAESERTLEHETLENQDVAIVPSRTSFVQPLPIQKVGAPHRLTIRYWREQPAQFIAAVRQQNSAGGATHLGLDSVIEDRGASQSFNASVWGEYQVVFWPREANPQLLVENRADVALRIASIRVEAGPDQIPTALHRLTAPRFGPGTQVSRSLPGPLRNRSAAIYLNKPLLVDTFSVAKPVDPTLVNSEEADAVVLDDWGAFLLAGQRLVEYVQASGANTAIIGVYCDGGSLYPTALSQTTPRYDTGIFFSDSRDPFRKDVLELLLRLFDRAGLKLVPVLEVSSPLPALERKIWEGRQSGAAASDGMLWQDAVGRVLSESSTGEAAAARYNILDPRVQAAASEMISELHRRYQAHRSMAGLGLQLGRSTLFHLPASQWGQDRNTLQRFRAAMLAKAGAGSTNGMPSSNNEFNLWVNSDGLQWFQRWRTMELTSFLQRVATSQQGRPLYLVTADYGEVSNILGDGGDSQSDLDWSLVADDPHLVPLRLYRNQGLIEPALQMKDARVNESQVWDVLMQGMKRQPEPSMATAGALLYLPPTPTVLAGPAFESLTPPESEQLTVYPQVVHNEQRTRRQLAKLLAGFDARVMAIGGWTPRLGTTVALEAQTSDASLHQETVADWLDVFSTLPNVAFAEVPPVSPRAAIVTVRQHVGGEGCIVYALNPSPWPAEVLLMTTSQPGVQVNRLGPNRESWQLGQKPASAIANTGPVTASAPPSSVAPQPGASQADANVTAGSSNARNVVLWQGKLQPGELFAVEMVHAQQGVVSWDAQPENNAAILAHVTRVIEDLTERVALLGRPRPMAAITNSGFEDGNAQRISGWLRAQHPPGAVRFSQDAFTGDRAILLANSDSQVSPTWLLSQPFQAPETGRLALSLRVKAISGEPTLRVAIEGRRRGRPFRYTLEISPRVEDGWGKEPYQLFVDHLPTYELEEVRVAIDLTQSGSVAIDEIEVFDFFFTQQEREELQRQLFVAAQQVRRGDLTSAAKLLDSYWTSYLHWLGGQQLEKDVDSSPQSSTQSGDSSGQPTDIDGAAGGVTERLREWLPAPLRF